MYILVLESLSSHQCFGRLTLLWHVSDSYTLGFVLVVSCSLVAPGFLVFSCFRLANLLLSLITVSLVPLMENLIRQLFSPGGMSLECVFLQVSCSS